MSAGRGLAAILGAALCLIAAPPAKAGVPEGSRIATPLAEGLLSWVEQRLGADDVQLPIIVASRTALEETNRIVQHARQGERIKALYFPGLIVLDNETWSEADVVEVSYLLHELVHHVQARQGYVPACPAAYERDTYNLQNEWLKEQGRAPLYTADWIAEKSRCD
ncbi:DUF6647 family protein [Rhodocista pekingensis]|uniref:DUF6647 family protein n=1 Tax=Rhodocista pekingensis TaxID=201185 RepID=A0ABW2KS51_9PROT